ncbi:GDSL-type esterase/lipase family protein [Psychrobacillus vulpis]|uniref:Esterase n=1 Tax=Psychrobacillus vulpis TaxID=2325572 RepID=A0A544TVF1_9BACI|nr:GDSL-type esterase/lipase family protein [Psychrobacillus vulpis]TQR21415.1 esterase [Psychrobacillus vulpis]
MIKVVCFGDSITARKEGHPSPILTYKLSSKMQDYQFVNAGVSGSTTEQAMQRFKKDVLERKPDIVTILFGANDSAKHKLVNLESFKQNIFEFTKQVGPKKTILITPAPVDEILQPNRSNKLLKQYAQVVEEVADETGSHLIDFFTILFSKPNYKELLKGEKDDGLHFGEAGYDILSELIAHKLEEMRVDNKNTSLFQRLLNKFNK